MAWCALVSQVICRRASRAASSFPSCRRGAGVKRTEAFDASLVPTWQASEVRRQIDDPSEISSRLRIFEPGDSEILICKVQGCRRRRLRWSM